MEVWIVFSDHTTYVTTGNCYDEDGYYDDYWEEEYHETEVVCVCATEELAKKKTKECEINNTSCFTTFCYGPFEVLEESETRN